MAVFLVVYVAIPIVLVVLGVLFYQRSRASRMGLRCPACNEYMRIELMSENQRCNTCGAPLRPTEENNAQP